MIRAVGLLDRYRQYDDVPPEVLVAAAERRRERRRRALARAEVVDLSRTESPQMPDPEVVNAAIAALRGPINLPPDRHAAGLRSALAERLGVEAALIAVGHGISDLLERVLAHLAGSEEVAVTWPSHPLLPLAIERAGKKARPIERTSEALASAASAGCDLLICNPDDPTGHYFTSAQLAAVAQTLRGEQLLIVDEALIDYQRREHRDAVLRLSNRCNVVLLRTFSKAFGLAGLRIGYAVLPPTLAHRAGFVTPTLGVSAPAVAAATEALMRESWVEGQVGRIVAERERLARELRARGFDVSPSEANFLWVAKLGIDGRELARALERRAVRVASGAALGDRARVRIAVRDRAASDRLLSALDACLAELTQGRAHRSRS